MKHIVDFTTRNSFLKFFWIAGCTTRNVFQNFYAMCCRRRTFWSFHYVQNGNFEKLWRCRKSSWRCRKNHSKQTFSSVIEGFSKTYDKHVCPSIIKGLSWQTGHFNCGHFHCSWQIKQSSSTFHGSFQQLMLLEKMFIIK